MCIYCELLWEDFRQMKKKNFSKQAQVYLDISQAVYYNEWYFSIEGKGASMEQPKKKGDWTELWGIFLLFLKGKPLNTLKKSISKYTFGFRMGKSFHEAFDQEHDTTLKEATVESLKDTAKSTGNIYVSKTFFSLAKATFLESAVGGAIMSSSLMIWVRSTLTLLFAAFGKTTLGVFFTGLSASITLTFSTVATAVLTLFAGTQLGKFFFSTTIGGYFYQVLRFAISVFASVLPIFLCSIAFGYFFKIYKKKKEAKLEEVAQEGTVTRHSTDSNNPVAGATLHENAPPDSHTSLEGADLPPLSQENKENHKNTDNSEPKNTNNNNNQT